MRTRCGSLLLSALSLVVGCSEDPGADAETDVSPQGTTEAEEPATSSGTSTETDTDAPAEPVNLDLDAYPFERLSEYRFFQGELGDLVPNEGVIDYTVAAPLWADAAEKGRYFVIPEGTTIEFADQDVWDFPTGSVFIKNFYFDQDRGEAEDLRIVETRLLVREPDGEWQGYGYLWNDEQTEAERTKAGADVYIDYLDEAGDRQSQLYLVPDQNVCESCHRRDDRKLLLGPTTHQMNTSWAMGGGRWSTRSTGCPTTASSAEMFRPRATCPRWPTLPEMRPSTPGREPTSTETARTAIVPVAWQPAPGSDSRCGSTPQSCTGCATCPGALDRQRAAAATSSGLDTLRRVSFRSAWPARTRR